MSDTCFRCHGPDRNARMAGMRLDIRDEALQPTRSGRAPIVPGDPDKSEIIARISAAGRGRCRPHRPQGADGKQRRHFAAGWKAPSTRPLAYQPVRVLPCRTPPIRPGENPIDHFIQHRLGSTG
jgi:hypothetical protein